MLLLLGDAARKVPLAEQIVALALARMAGDKRSCHLQPIHTWLAGLAEDDNLLQQLDAADDTCGSIDNVTDAAKRVLLRRRAAAAAARAVRSQTALLEACRVLWTAVCAALGGAARAADPGALAAMRAAPVWVDADGNKVPQGTPGATEVTGPAYGGELIVAALSHCVTRCFFPQR